MWAASGSAAELNALLAALVFTPAANFHDNFSIATSVSNGVAPPLTGNKAMTGTAIAVPPPANAAPTLTANQSLTVDEGGTGLIDATLLHATDAEDAPAQLRFSIGTTLLHGRLELGSAPGVALSSFTQADIDAGQLRYVHDGSETLADTFSFSVTDSQGASIGSVSFTVVVRAVNDPPTLSSTTSGATTITADGVPQSIDTAIQVADVDSAQLVQAVVRIGNQYRPGSDVLTVGNAHGLSAVWNPADGTLTLSGAASAGDYAAALASVMFASTDAASGARTVDFAVNDGAAASSAFTRALVLTASVPVAVPVPAPAPAPAPAPTSTPAPAPTSSASLPAAPTPVAIAVPATLARTELSTPSAVLAPGPDQAVPAAAPTADGRAARADSLFGDSGRPRVEPLISASQARASFLSNAVDTSRSIATVTATQQPADRTDSLALIRSLLDAINGDRNGGNGGESGAPSETLDLVQQAALRADGRALPTSISSQRSAGPLQIGGTPGADNEGGDESEDWHFDLLPHTGLTGGLLLSASVLWWATRAGGLVAAMMASVPAWRSFDPLPVLVRDGAKPRDELAPAPAASTAPAPPTPAATMRALMEQMTEAATEGTGDT